mgnify:CR=1 FL=1
MLLFVYKKNTWEKVSIIPPISRSSYRNKHFVWPSGSQRDQATSCQKNSAFDLMLEKAAFSRGPLCTIQRSSITFSHYCCCSLSLSLFLWDLLLRLSNEEKRRTSLFCPILYREGISFNTCRGTFWSRMPDTMGGAAVKIRLKKINERSSMAFEPENPL